MRSIAEIFRANAVVVDGRHTDGCDKQTNHNYSPAYEQLFPDRDAVRLMMEVGITDGSSMKAWREIFPNALVVGLDIEPCHARHSGLDRMEFHIGNQRSREDCERAAGGRQFDFILDDACHEIDANLLTFGYLWSFVKPGGLYVVEECGDMAIFCAATIPKASVVPTNGPFGGIEPLIVVRKHP